MEAVLQRGVAEQRFFAFLPVSIGQQGIFTKTGDGLGKGRFRQGLAQGELDTFLQQTAVAVVLVPGFCGVCRDVGRKERAQAFFHGRVHPVKVQVLLRIACGRAIGREGRQQEAEHTAQEQQWLRQLCGDAYPCGLPITPCGNAKEGVEEGQEQQKKAELQHRGLGGQKLRKAQSVEKNGQQKRRQLQKETGGEMTPQRIGKESFLHYCSQGSSGFPKCP